MSIVNKANIYHRKDSNMRPSKFLKFVCYALIIATLINGSIAPTAMAFATSPIPEQGFTDSIFNAARVNDQAVSKDTDNESFVELNDKRTEYIKYYQLDSKLFEAVSFGLPVHYLEDGEYKQIDNSLELSTTKDGKEKYINKANSFRVELATALSSDWTASISKEQYKISWSIIGVSKELLAASASSLESGLLPTLEPTVAPTAKPTLAPTLEPTIAPSTEPTLAPIPDETPESESPLTEEAAIAQTEATATPDATAESEETPAEEATPAPTTGPTPISEATPAPTVEPEALPTPEPALSPSSEPTLTPSFDKFMQFGAALAPSAALASEGLAKDAWKELSKGEQRRTIPGISSDVMYKDVLPGVDLQYVVISDRIKENMILNKPTKVAQITQKLQADDLTLVKEADGTITAIAADTQETVFKLQAPYMMDKEGIGCNISFDLFESEGLYYLVYNLDQEWLATAKYPVMIDPTVTTSLDPKDINDSRICSNMPNSNNATSHIMCTGYGSSSGINYSLTQFNNLPKLGPSSMITKATYSLKRASSSTVNSTISVHEITSSWTPGTVTWNNKPTFNSTIEDYNVVDTVAGKKWDWDITRIAKSWYSGGTNYGILLKDISDSGGYKEWYTTNNPNSAEVPSVTFQYTDFAGIEEYWDYASSDIGRGGSTNVNFYNGNMIYMHSDLEMDGSRMPVAINHVFNSTFRNEKNDDMLFGNGWRTNYDQRVESLKINSTLYYKYTDEDGTAHYFAFKDNEWTAEDGIDLKLTIGTDNTITIKDKTDNIMVLHEVVDPIAPVDPDAHIYYLSYIEDNNGNRQTIGYDANDRINQITDGAGRVILFERDEDGYLKAIKQPVDGINYRSIEYIYENDQLTGIRYPDDNTTTFTYDSNGNLTSATNFDGKKTTITYQDAAPFRVAQFEESNGSTLGEKISFSYGYNRTEATDVEGRKSQYQFNDFGNTVCTIAPDGGGQYTGFGTLGSDGKVTDINKITLSSKAQKFGKNILLNHNMEASTNWIINSYSGSTGSQGYATDQKYYGAKSVKLTKTNTAGYASSTQNITLEKGKTYTVSGFIKTSNVSGPFGAYIRALYYNASGSETWIDSPVLVGTNDWERYSVTFTVPADASTANAQIYLLLKGSTGTVWFDAVQLEEGSVANRYNLVENADFSSYSGNTPTFWTRGNLTTSDTIDTSADNANPVYMSDARFKINGDCKPSTAKYVGQTVYMSGKADDSFVLGGWAKGTSVSLTRESGKIFGLTAKFQYTDGTTDAFPSLVSFSEDSNIWQYACGAIVAQKDYSSIIIQAHYSGEANSAWFDGIQLLREQFGETYSYDANGNLLSAKDLESKKDEYKYTNNDLTQYKTPDQREYSYTYDSKHNLKAAVSPSGLAYAYEYDSYGNQIESKFGNESEYIRSTTSYTADGNYVAKIIDPFGKINEYNFDLYKGTLAEATDANGKTVQYSYDTNLDLQTGVSKTDVGKTLSDSYDYTDDYLTGISHNSPDAGNVRYNLAYNGLGWKMETKVGSQSLTAFTLKDRTGRLEATNYGNGQAINYTYDACDRLTKISQNSNNLYAYEYDNAGNIGYQMDLVNGNEFWYEYDSMQRLGKRISKDTSGIINWAKYGFDNKNNLTSFKEKIGAAEYTTTYTYDNEDRLKTSAFGSSGTEIRYDAILGRVMNFARIVNGGTIFNTSYMYAPGDGVTSTASERVSAITNGSETLNYTYDNKGFITSISSGSESSQYRYDAFGQLIRENYNWNGMSYTELYSYDEGGNITSKIKYSYAEGDGDVGTPIENVDYEYEDVNWKDKLTKYNGHSISYDEIGNPIDDSKWLYTWTQGRNLQSMNDGVSSINFKYNDKGLRTEKTVNGVTTKYNLSDDMITFEKRGSETPIYYLYDVNGDLWGLNYKGNIYFYVRNAHNDIISIVNTSGLTVVTYDYNAWGEVLHVGGDLATTLGQDNPFLYRGYYYDWETKLYYLNSRFYSPDWHRFLNADADSVLGANEDILLNNLFIYCINNPVNMQDELGDMPITATALAVTAVVAAVAVSVVYIATTRPGQRSFKGLGKAISKSIATTRAIVTLAVTTAIVYAKSKIKSKSKNPDPNARPGQKKQGREKKEEKKKKNWEDRSGNRRVKPPKKHTPGKEHQKYKQGGS